MAGLGGFMGYGLGGINWDATTIGRMLGGHLHATFTLVTIIFIVCVSYTITSFKEIPLEVLERDEFQQYHESMVRLVSYQFWSTQFCLLTFFSWQIASNKIDEENQKITAEESTTYGALEDGSDKADVSQKLCSLI